MAYREWFFLAQPIPTDLTDITTFPGQTLAIYRDRSGYQAEQSNVDAGGKDGGTSSRCFVPYKSQPDRDGFPA